MNNNAVEINDLCKKFASTTALDDVSFNVARGELFGIIGPDGAGKTTLFRILATLMTADKGSAIVGGYDIAKNIKEIRSSVGYMPGRFSLYPDLSVRENLEFFASLFNTTVEDNYDIIAPIYERLKPFESRRAGKLSGGMKQKLALSCALIHHPDIVFLDEPTTGVDAVSRREFWDILARLKELGITILVSTPYMDEASRCDRIALLNQGKLLRTGTVDELTGQFKYHLYAVSADNMFRLLGMLREMSVTKQCYPFGSSHHLVTYNVTDTASVKKELEGKGMQNVMIKEIKPTIEDLFITLMQ